MTQPRLAAETKRQQQRVFRVPQHRLSRVHDLVDEQQAFALDIDFTGATLQGHQADDVLAATAEPLGRGVGHESPRASITACTRWRVSGWTRLDSRMTRETVAVETPATRATS